MTDFLHNLGLVCATALGAGAITFGIRAGLELGHWVFGAFKINLNVPQINIVQRDHYADIEHEHLGCPTAKTGIYADKHSR